MNVTWTPFSSVTERPAGGNGMTPSLPGCVEVDQERPAAVVDPPPVVPAPDAGVASGIGGIGGVGGECPCRQVAVERQRARGIVDVLDQRHDPGQAGQLTPIVRDLDPVAGAEAEDRVAPHPGDDELVRGWDAGDRRGDRSVVPRPLEGRVVEPAAVVDLDAVEVILQALVAAAGGSQAGVVLFRDADRGGGQAAGGGGDEVEPALQIAVG